MLDLNEISETEALGLIHTLWSPHRHLKLPTLPGEELAKVLLQLEDKGDSWLRIEETPAVSFPHMRK